MRLASGVENGCSFGNGYGYIINFVDTAGIRDKDKADVVEKIGIENSLKTIETSNIVLFLFENSIDEIDKNLIEFAKDKEILYIQTKCDINKPTSENNVINISSMTGFGINILKDKIYEIVQKLAPEELDYTTNKRQQACLIQAKNALLNVMQTSEFNCEPDLFAMDLKSAILSLGEIVGEVFTDTILDDIFSNFCIGK